MTTTNVIDGGAPHLTLIVFNIDTLTCIVRYIFRNWIYNVHVHVCGHAQLSVFVTLLLI